MPSVFLDPERLSRPEVTIRGDQARYLGRVLRMSPGDSLWILDGIGGRYRATVKQVSREELVVHRGPRETPAVEPPVGIRLVQALPKAEKMKWILQKAVEVGVTAVNPVVSERSAVQSTRKGERWQRIAEAAAAQAGRVRVPLVGEPRPLAEAIDEYGPPGLVCWEEDGEELRPALREIAGQNPSEITVFVGPEGGLTADEVARARDRGHRVISLGPRILRTETAGLVALSIILYELGGLG